jgi:SAM-dependent methyltransferase
MPRVTLNATTCAICGPARSVQLYGANVAPADFNPDVFSQRRLPDRVHYRMVRCAECGLVRADPAADASLLEPLYKQSAGFGAEEANLRLTYGRYLRRLRRHGAAGGSLLEIGCGTGFFLIQAQAEGYQPVTGVEPSVAAASANPAIADRIVRELMQPGLFAPDTFDVVCLFQVFDHVPDPNALLAECLRVLRPGGLILALNHNVEAVTNRLLRDRSPIIDIEHTYLYGPATMRSIFARNRFDILETGRAWNDYSLNYLARLVPVLGGAKTLLLKLTSATVGGLRLRVSLGNLYLVGRKPLQSPVEIAR